MWALCFGRTKPTWRYIPINTEVKYTGPKQGIGIAIVIWNETSAWVSLGGFACGFKRKKSAGIQEWLMKVNPEMLPHSIPSKKRGLIQPVRFVCKLILHRERDCFWQLDSSNAARHLEWSYFLFSPVPHIPWGVDNERLLPKLNVAHVDRESKYTW